MLLQSSDCKHIVIGTIAIVRATSSIESVILNYRSSWTFVFVPAAAVWLFVEMTIKKHSLILDFSLNFS